MSAFPTGAWDLQRPNIVSWASDLNNAHPSLGLNEARGYLFELGRRLDTLLQVPIHEDEDDEDEDEVEEDETMPPPPVPVKSRKAKQKQAEVPEAAENDPPVSVLLRSFSSSNKHSIVYSLRRRSGAMSSPCQPGPGSTMRSLR